MEKLAKIKAPVEGDFVRYEQFMKEALHSGSPYVEDIMNYVISNRGKGIRPMLVFLLAGMHSVDGTIGKRAYLAAMLVEMIHNASLVHDDVVDDAAVRHGKPSVNSKWNSRVSVLAGDYILSRSFSAGMESGQYDIVSYVTTGVSELAEGELMQVEVNEKRSVARADYLNIIFKKTATLMGVSCGAGAMASGASGERVAWARQIGLDLGMAFQIKDDILDYCPQEQTGKPFCADLREKKITLPLLTILERGDDGLKRKITQKMDVIDEFPEAIREICDLVIREGGIVASENVMHDYIGRARMRISSYPESAFRTSMLELCDYIGSRDY